MSLYFKVIITVILIYGIISILSCIDNKFNNSRFRTFSVNNEQIIKKTITAMLGALLALNCIDATSTWFAIANGIAEEQNGIMGWIISCGWGWFFVFKIGLASLVVAELYFLYVKEINIFNISRRPIKRNAIMSGANMCLFVGLYVWVCANNLSLILDRL